MDRQDTSFALIVGVLLGAIAVRVWDIYQELTSHNVNGVGSSRIPVPQPPKDPTDLRQV